MAYRLEGQAAPAFPAAVAILAGGDSRRMGRDKAALPIDGMTLLERTARLARGTGLPVFVVGRYAPNDWPLPDVHFFPDNEPGLGPLAGLQTALQHAPSVLALSCDLPMLTDAALAWLIDVAAPSAHIDGLAVRNADRMEPLFSVYTARCLPLIGQVMASGRRSLTRLVEEGEFTIVEAPPEVAASLENVNTPEAWDVILQRHEIQHGDAKP